MSLSDLSQKLEILALQAKYLVGKEETRDQTESLLSQSILALQHENENLREEIAVYKLEWVPNNVCLWKQSMNKWEKEVRDHEVTKRLLVKAKQDNALLKKGIHVSDSSVRQTHGKTHKIEEADEETDASMSQEPQTADEPHLPKNTEKTMQTTISAVAESSTATSSELSDAMFARPSPVPIVISITELSLTCPTVSSTITEENLRTFHDTVTLTASEKMSSDVSISGATSISHDVETFEVLSSVALLTSPETVSETSDPISKENNEKDAAVFPSPPLALSSPSRVHELPKTKIHKVNKGVAKPVESSDGKKELQSQIPNGKLVTIKGNPFFLGDNDFVYIVDEEGVPTSTVKYEKKGGKYVKFVKKTNPSEI